jgi:FMN phosphatase YigB (HAD superfamily)
MKKFINQFDLEKYFINTHFSADYNIRKPHKDIFKIVFDDIKEYDDSIQMEEVYFIGDNFEADVLGAENFGFTPVFINRKQDVNINNKNFIEIKSLGELLEIVR